MENKLRHDFEMHNPRKYLYTKVKVDLHYLDKIIVMETNHQFNKKRVKLVWLRDGYDMKIAGWNRRLTQRWHKIPFFYTLKEI